MVTIITTFLNVRRAAGHFHFFITVDGLKICQTSVQRGVQVPSGHRVSDPAEEVAKSGVDAVLPPGGTFLPPADHTAQKPSPSVVHHEGSAAVATAGVDVHLQVSSTEHVVCDHLQEHKHKHRLPGQSPKEREVTRSIG